MAAHIKTGNFLLPWQANAVSAHRAQTLLVEELLRRGTLSWSQVRNSEDPETGDEREIFEWHFFQEFGDFDYRALEKAWIPVLRSPYGNWVGFESCGSDYDLYVRPALVKALYGIEADYAAIQKVRAI